MFVKADEVELILGAIRQAGRQRLDGADPRLPGMRHETLEEPLSFPMDDWHGIAAGLFAAMAMGTQSVIVRLLMHGIPQPTS
jgi:hypothetical protein